MDAVGLFTVALGLQSPWKVEDIQFGPEQGKSTLIWFAEASAWRVPVVAKWNSRSMTGLNAREASVFLPVQSLSAYESAAGALEFAVPELEALHQWLIRSRALSAHGGSSAKALDYSLRLWPALIRYAQTGHLSLDNSAIEQSIRPIAVGKKGWIFSPVPNAQAN